MIKDFLGGGGGGWRGIDEESETWSHLILAGLKGGGGVSLLVQTRPLWRDPSTPPQSRKFSDARGGGSEQIRARRLGWRGAPSLSLPFSLSPVGGLAVHWLHTLKGLTMPRAGPCTRRGGAKQRGDCWGRLTKAARRCLRKGQTCAPRIPGVQPAKDAVSAPSQYWLRLIAFAAATIQQLCRGSVKPHSGGRMLGLRRGGSSRPEMSETFEKGTWADVRFGETGADVVGLLNVHAMC